MLGEASGLDAIRSGWWPISILKNNSENQMDYSVTPSRPRNDEVRLTGEKEEG